MALLDENPYCYDLQLLDMIITVPGQSFGSRASGLVMMSVAKSKPVGSLSLEPMDPKECKRTKSTNTEQAFTCLVITKKLRQLQKIGSSKLNYLKAFYDDSLGIVMRPCDLWENI